MERDRTARMARVLLVQKTYIEMFGVMSVAGVLRARGHEVRVSLERGPRLARDAAAFEPKVAGFTAVSLNVGENLRDAALVRAALPGAPVIFGGVHTTFFPELVERPEVDAVCRGEGEFALAEFVEAVASGADTSGILNLWLKSDSGIVENPLRPHIADLDALPFPDRAPYYDRYPFLKNNPVKNFLCSRGCPYSCSFCFNTTYRRLQRNGGHSAGPRTRSPESMIEEIKDFRARWPLQKLAFQDENFCLNRDWLNKFLELYRKEIGLPFFCMINAAIADREIVSSLRASGCYHTTFGVESGDETLRRAALKKPVTDEQMRNAAALLHEAGITFHTTNIFCFPGETVASAVRTITFNAELKPASAIAFLFTPFYNLDLTEAAIGGGWLTKAQATDWERLPRVVVRVPQWRRIRRLSRLFSLGVRRPALIPLIVRLSALPLGAVFLAVAFTADAIDYVARNRQNLVYMFRNAASIRRLYKSYRFE